MAEALGTSSVQCKEVPTEDGAGSLLIRVFFLHSAEYRIEYRTGTVRLDWYRRWLHGVQYYCTVRMVHTVLYSAGLTVHTWTVQHLISLTSAAG